MLQLQIILGQLLILVFASAVSLQNLNLENHRQLELSSDYIAKKLHGNLQALNPVLHNSNQVIPSPISAYTPVPQPLLASGLSQPQSSLSFSHGQVNPLEHSSLSILNSAQQDNVPTIFQQPSITSWSTTPYNFQHSHGAIASSLPQLPSPTAAQLEHLDFEKSISIETSSDKGINHGIGASTVPGSIGTNAGALSSTGGSLGMSNSNELDKLSSQFNGQTLNTIQHQLDLKLSKLKTQDTNLVYNQKLEPVVQDVKIKVPIKRPVFYAVPKKVPVPIIVNHPVLQQVIKKVPLKVEIEKPILQQVQKEIKYEVPIYKAEAVPVEQKIPVPSIVKMPFSVTVQQPVPVPHYVPKPVPIPVHKDVPISVPNYRPILQQVEKVVPIQVTNYRPVPVAVQRDVPVPVPQLRRIPYPVTKDIYVPVERLRHVPVAVDKLVPVPTPVLKHVPVPVQQNVPVQVPVYRTFPVQVEKFVPTPVEVRKPVPIPVVKNVPMLQVFKQNVNVPIVKQVPNPVPVFMQQNIPVPRLLKNYYPVDTHVHVPLERKVMVPVNVDKIVKVPFERTITYPLQYDRYVPVPIPKDVAIPFSYPRPVPIQTPLPINVQSTSVFKGIGRPSTVVNSAQFFNDYMGITGQGLSMAPKPNILAAAQRPVNLLKGLHVRKSTSITPVDVLSGVHQTSSVPMPLQHQHLSSMAAFTPSTGYMGNSLGMPVTGLIDASLPLPPLASISNYPTLPPSPTFYKSGVIPSAQQSSLLLSGDGLLPSVPINAQFEKLSFMSDKKMDLSDRKRRDFH